jgi:hypothetical protein
MPIALLPAEPVALICAVMADAEPRLTHARDALVEQLGPLYCQSAVYPFAFTSYYEAEMGTGLIKQLLCFGERVDPAELPRIKRWTMELEKRMGREERERILRQVNVDPGLVSIESLVLATTKYSGHRICIAPSLYAEVTLLYQKGRYAPLQWTYQDYQTEAIQQFLLEIRAWLMEGRRRQDS